MMLLFFPIFKSRGRVTGSLTLAVSFLVAVCYCCFASFLIVSPMGKGAISDFQWKTLCELFAEKQYVNTVNNNTKKGKKIISKYKDLRYLVYLFRYQEIVSQCCSGA